eukprot:m.56943 g.56943  ORF g.56943 m.56943 type:complete len:59 (+) comp13699_c1_seq2:1090-1266(+)
MNTASRARHTASTAHHPRYRSLRVHEEVLASRHWRVVKQPVQLPRTTKPVELKKHVFE